MKTKFLICLAFTAGVALGFFLARPSTIQAQSGVVRITRVHSTTTLGSALVVGRAFSLYSAGEGGFNLGVDLVGGTILVYEVDESKTPDNFKAEDLANALHRRIDPAELKIRYLVHADLLCEPLNVPVEFVADVEVTTGKVHISRL